MIFDSAARFEEWSPWMAPPGDPTGPLECDLQGEVAVVGAGYTGLATALALRAEGADVIVLEQDFAGSGASGRNAGHLTPTIGKDLPSLLRLHGRERAAALVRFADRAVEATEEVIAKHGIDCEYEPSGNVMAAVHSKQTERLRRAAETGAELGAQVRFLEPEAMRERGLPEAFCAGVLEEKGGTLHPGRYVEGLRRAALAAGVRLFEQSPVCAIEDETRPRLRTAAGTVRAQHVVVATNAYTPALGWKTRAVIPLRVTLFETEPLDEGQRALLGWPGREGIYTAHETLESYRLTPQGTIVGGSKVVRYAWRSGLAPGRDPRAFAIVEGAFRARFPDLHEVPIARFWGGWIALPLDFLPWLGSAGARGRLHFGLGYAGHGVAQATLMGAMLADQVRGRTHPCADALSRRPWSWPPEPFRWLAFHAVTRLLDVVDGRTDRAARRRARA